MPTTRRRRFSNVPTTTGREAHHTYKKIVNPADVITRMRDRGTVLRMHFRTGREIWWLEGVGEVEKITAAKVIEDPQVIAVGTSLFPDFSCPAQTYRFIHN
jgi:hypothetical protein